MISASPAMPTLTIAILSRQCLVRLGLQKILESSETRQMVVLPSQPWTHKRLPTESRPDVVILDLETERDALGIIKQIRESVPTSKIVLLCGFEDKDRLRETFAYGVDGVILKIQPPEIVLAVIEALCIPTKLPALVERDGMQSIDLETPFAKELTYETQPPMWPDALTEREHEIIRLVGQGLSNKDIAYKLSISDSTVRHHMTNIFGKVGVSNRQKLLIRAHHVRPTPV